MEPILSGRLLSNLSKTEIGLWDVVNTGKQNDMLFQPWRVYVDGFQIYDVAWH